MKLIKMICNGLFLLWGTIVFILFSIPIMIKDRKYIFKCRYHSIDPPGKDVEA